ncbi:MAG: ABC transporter substrate-binding protein [Candidatus Caldarchaeum sp.]|nr:ABC transporter substrate-binding protein [Candidatus Caldarchaeum sp.]MDW7978890.1 ABC transporter substrate-binding protein [Candidatus Caldarchaeum sp.]
MSRKSQAISRIAVVAVVVVVLAAAAVGGLFLTGVLTPTPEKRQVVIGLSLPLTNPVGIHAKYAAEMAVQEINSAGGVMLNGTRYELVLVAEDTNEMDPLIPVDQGVTAFKRLVELHGAHVIVGGVRTDVVVAQSQLLSQYKIVFLDIESNQRIVEDLVQSDYENYKYYFHFFAGGRNSSAGPYIATIPVALRNAAQRNPNFPDVSKVALVAENALWTVGLAGRPAGNSTFFARLKAQGFDLVFAELYPTTQSDFSSYLARIKQSGAGLIILLFSGPPGVAFVKQWAAYDWSPGKKPIVFGPGLLGGFSWFWDQTGGAAQGTIWWPATVKVPVTSKTIPFIEKFTQRYRETPNTAAFDTYDAIYVLKAALERANTWKADRLVPALEQTDYDGVIGKIQFSRKLHGLNLANHNLYWYFGQWQNGELVPVWSPDKPQEVRNMILP